MTILQTFIYLDGLVVENGSFQPQNLMKDVVTSSTDVFVLIGIGILAAIGLGIGYAVWLILTGGN